MQFFAFLFLLGGLTTTVMACNKTAFVPSPLSFFKRLVYISLTVTYSGLHLRQNRHIGTEMYGLQSGLGERGLCW